MKDTAKDIIATVVRVLIAMTLVAGADIIISDIISTWHDTRVICQHVTHSQKECR